MPDLTKARKKRALQARRDQLLEQKLKNKSELAKVRAELKSLQSRR